MSRQSQKEQAADYKKIQHYIYKFSDQIGMGNFSKVFKGFNELNHKQVAIKTIELNSLNNQRLKELLNTETTILKTLNHPNVIHCEEILSSLRNCYIITQLCNEGDLQSKLKKSGPMPEKDLYPIITDVYEGLKYLAKLDIIHRDIKISNIFIHNSRYKIADFGFAQVSEKSFNDISVGSPIYMSPEGYINNSYGPKTDVWALGVLLYQLIQGKTPCYDCKSQQQLKNKLLKQIDKNSFVSIVSQSLKELVIQCLTVNQKQRPTISNLEKNPWIQKAQGIIKNRMSVTQDHSNSHEKHQNKIFNLNLIKRSFDMSNKTQKDETLKKKVIDQSDRKTKFNTLSDNFFKPQKNGESQSNLQKDKDNLKLDRKNFTVEKPSKLYENKVSPSYIKGSWNGKATDIFYSPKNDVQKMKGMIMKHTSPKQKITLQTHNNESLIANESIPLNHDHKGKENINSSNQNKLFSDYKKYFHHNNAELKLSKPIRENSSAMDSQSKTKNSSAVQDSPVISRVMKFGDCIGLIHYCRLCYKFSCLLDEQGGEEKAKLFYTAWSVQMLEELMHKIKSGDILYGNEEPLINNPSQGVNEQDNEKKKKLKDVTEEYLQKYSRQVGKKREKIGIKEASAFTYEMYIQKSHQFKEKATEKRPELYFALICYLSTLDRETRSLMQFIFQMRKSLQGRQLQKLLGIKIEQFSRKHVEEATLGQQNK